MTRESVCPGGDPATSSVGCSVDEGNHSGTLTSGTNEEDIYHFAPTSDTIIRIGVEANGLIEASLTDPSGQVRATDDNLRHAVEISSAAKPEGNWTLRIQIMSISTGVYSVGYNFDLLYEPHDNFLQLEAEGGHVSTVHASLPENRFAFLELTYELSEELVPEATPYVQVADINFTDSRSRTRGTVVNMGGWNYAPPPQVWIRSQESENVELAIPNFKAGSYSGRIVVENTSRSFEFGFGLAISSGIEEVTGWAVWDTSNFTVNFPKGAKATFAQVNDFKGENADPGVKLGPYAQASGLSLSYEDPPGYSTVAAANALTPDLATEPTHLAVTDPAGSTVDLQGDFRFWNSPTLDQEGTWSVELKHTDGYEADRYRFVAASFPIDPWQG